MRIQCLSAALVMAMPLAASADALVTTLDRGSVIAPVIRSNPSPFVQFFFPNDYQPEYQVWAAGFGQPSRVEVARSFHIFDLSGLTGTVTGAEITFFHPGDNGLGSTSYDSPDSSETVTFYNVGSQSISDIDNAANFADVFNDVGSGTTYGTLTADASVNTIDATGTFQTITLNANAIADIQAAINAGGDWAIGGALTTFQTDPSGIGTANERVFRGSGPASFPNGLPATSLNLIGSVAIPEPSAVALVMVGLATLTVRRRQQA